MIAGILVLGVLHAQDGKIPLSTSSQDARTQFLAGRTLVDNLRLTDAIPFFQRAVELDSGFALAHLYLAQTAPTAKIFFAELGKAVKLIRGVTSGERLWILGVRAGAYADPAGQLKLYRELAEQFPRDERAQTLLGITFFAQQDYVSAAEHLRHATEVNPGFAPAYNQLGYAYRFLDRYGDAERIFRRYTELIPNDPNPYDSYAELLLKMGKFEESIVQYRKALSIDRNFANSYAGIAAAHAYQGEHAKARETLATALDVARTDGERRAALFALTAIALDEGDTAGALREVESQFDLGKKIGDPAAMAGDVILKGNILLESGNADGALQKYTEAARMIGTSDLAREVRENAALVYHYNAGRAEVGKKNLTAAAEEAKVFREGALAKKNINQIRLASELEGMIALQAGECKQAVALFRESNLQNPYNLYRLALAYRAIGNQEQARECCTRAARFNVLPAPNYAFVRAKAEKLLKELADRNQPMGSR